ncbi:multidrug effflux MFS transporter [Achromobacter sp. GG226]|uniref:multidrug effflux MFS transporter n=1 Tax=Verticiella alkaliphila TaxID=2779529 RepID=UPI001C0C578B|nr:multidrug effflux MFS transporter [Verticiella sp. GG226]MBU4610951.1 multidrug effflux MFS transporter [Verticiella sp. GG226]
MSGWLLLMGLLTMTGPLAIDMYLPAFPSISQALGAASGAVERTLAMYLIGMAIGQLVYGPATDRWGRKPPLYVGLALYVVASAACAMAQSIESLTFWRFIQALGGSACMVVPRAVIRDHYDTQQAARAMSMLMLIIGVAPMAAPFLGAQILTIATWRATFAILAFAGTALFLAVLFGMRETLPVERRVRASPLGMLRTYRDLLRDKGFLCMALAGGLGMGGLFAYVTGSPHVLIEVYGVTPTTFSGLFAVNALAMTLAAQVNARLLAGRHPSRIVRVALWVMPAIGILGLLLAVTGLMTLPILIVFLASFMAAQGFIGPNSAALALSGQGGRLGAASAMLGTLQFLCGTFIGLLVSLWRTESAIGLVGIMAVAGVLACVSGRLGLAAQAARAASAPPKVG